MEEAENVMRGRRLVHSEECMYMHFPDLIEHRAGVIEARGLRFCNLLDVALDDV